MSRLQAMELFVAAVREGSFSAAGRRAGLSPASVARHVSMLESDLGVQLLNRTSRSLSLTEAGQIYLTRVEAILREIQDTDDAVRALQSTPRGLLRVHSRMMFGMRVVSPLIPAFQARYPDLRVELRLSEQAAQLPEQEFDVDLRIGPSPDSGLKQRLLLRSERILVASSRYLAAGPAISAPRDLVRHRCLTYWIDPEAVVWRFRKEESCEEISISDGFSSNSGEVLRQLAIAGHGIALLDDYTVEHDRAAGRLVRLLPEWRVSNTVHFGSGIYAVFHPAKMLPAKTRAFLDFMAEFLPGLIFQSEISALTDRSGEE
ncbi:LysR family transcriptional regulator [Roseomonas sp. GC11]|uniref:LysR family transcriptional regulator n=1 Tax=Roseomonas sp. GC11 TaxID=2950546 RepID=UPI0021090DE2|nr:LysR family transcriptional regulator [Roseomonas sp. GC11]MCQ4159026.1 LysR family transcriptional regulator [Roseomonas sp. GC11]